MVRLLTGFLLLLSLLPALAQTDSLTISDTIGVSRQRVFLQTITGYTYYGANRLTGSQLFPILKRSPDSLTHKLLSQSRRLNWLATGLFVGGLGLIVESYAVAGRRRGPATGLLLAGDAAFLASFIPQNISSRRQAQAINAHNIVVRFQQSDYTPPVVYAGEQPWLLSLADTIGRKRVGLTQQYSYRGIRVYPASQLSKLTAGLNDREVNAGIRYVRTIGTINGLVGSAGRIFLTSYLASLLVNRRYRGSSSLNDEFLTAGLLCIGANFVLSRHANQVQQRWVGRFNDRLKQTFPRAQPGSLRP